MTYAICNVRARNAYCMKFSRFKHCTNSFLWCRMSPIDSGRAQPLPRTLPWSHCVYHSTMHSLVLRNKPNKVCNVDENCTGQGVPKSATISITCHSQITDGSDCTLDILFLTFVDSIWLKLKWNARIVFSPEEKVDIVLFGTRTNCGPNIVNSPASVVWNIVAFHGTSSFSGM